jgi:hypothetical protein
MDQGSERVVDAILQGAIIKMLKRDVLMKEEWHHLK